ncbi:MAG: proprotein convertase P-domain-containing protein, partial [Thermoflexales bacterium]|nr:proprotein convertase P-domain-containing protein [Thermoflexales bacterium]
TQISRALIVDVEPPSISALSVTINGQTPEAGLLIDTPLIEANVSIAATSDGSGVSRYLYGWTNFLTYTLDQLNEHVVSPAQLIVSSLVLTDVENLDAAHDGEARYFHFIAEDVYGNQHVETFGPIYHDLPAKPDYIGMSEPLGPFESHPYRLWTNACSLIGTDTRIPREALADSELRLAQSLYATWDHQALRLAWTGAHWNVDGDLFIYLDTIPDEVGGTYVRHGGNVAYNPYTSTNPSTLALLPVSDWATPPGGSAPAFDAMNADYALWITDNHTVHLLRWDNTINQWVEDAAAQSLGVVYAFDEELDAPHTDLSIPFAQLGITDLTTAQISLVAFASEKDALRLWSVVPASNPADSARITLHTPPLGEPHKLTLTDRYTFALADGTCLSDSERLSFELEADHAGFTYNSNDDAVRLILGNTFSAAFDAYDAAYQTWLSSDYCPTHPTEPACRPDKPTHTLSVREQLEPLMETQFPPLLPGQHLSFTVLYDNEFAVTQTLPARLTADGLAWNADTPWLNGCAGWLNVVAAPNAHGTAIEFGGTVMSNGEGVVSLDINPADTLNPDCSITPGVGEPFAALHIDYDHDTTAPGYIAIKEPRALIATTNNTLYGVVLDHSPVPTITLEVQTPSNGTASQTCLDATPEDGEWTCAFNATTLNGGTPAHDDVFNVRARATDLFGNISAWTDWLALRVDANPPTITLDSALQARFAQHPLNGEPTLNGTALDDHEVKSITACDASGQDCAPARLTNNAASQTQTTFVADDTPSTPIPIGAGNGPQNSAALSSCGVGNFGIVRSFDIVSNFSIAEVSLGLNLRHPYRSDLTAYLQSPSGTMATVISSTARTLAQNYDVLMTDATLDTLFADHIDHDLSVPIFEDARLPVTPFSVFRGEPALGTWLLLICDTDSSADTGAYQRGELIVRGDLAPDHTSTDWDYVLPNTQGIDGETRAYTLWGMDSLGNRTTSPLNVAVRIDTVAPVITVTNALQAAIFISNSLPVLSGFATDGGGLSDVFITGFTPFGELIDQSVPLNGNAWQFDLLPTESGRYTFYVEATDEAGNQTTVGPFKVDITLPAPYQTYLPIVRR